MDASFALQSRGLFPRNDSVPLWELGKNLEKRVYFGAPNFEDDQLNKSSVLIQADALDAVVKGSDLGPGIKQQISALIGDLRRAVSAPAPTPQLPPPAAAVSQELEKERKESLGHLEKISDLESEIKRMEFQSNISTMDKEKLEKGKEELESTRTRLSNRIKTLETDLSQCTVELARVRAGVEGKTETKIKEAEMRAKQQEEDDQRLKREQESEMDNSSAMRALNDDLERAKKIRDGVVESVKKQEDSDSIRTTYDDALNSIDQIREDFLAVRDKVDMPMIVTTLADDNIGELDDIVTQLRAALNAVRDPSKGAVTGDLARRELLNDAHADILSDRGRKKWITWNQEVWLENDEKVQEVVPVLNTDTNPNLEIDLPTFLSLTKNMSKFVRDRYQNPNPALSGATLGHDIEKSPKVTDVISEFTTVALAFLEMNEIQHLAFPALRFRQFVRAISQINLAIERIYQQLDKPDGGYLGSDPIVGDKGLWENVLMGQKHLADVLDNKAIGALKLRTWKSGRATG